ncbi:bifunctional Helicase [Babesia duncani]|uniref:Bifunctional Helicase n=1 Tax=Babesia duncani TaxID=323732 RepID=A0AAD9PJI2_9APIC|nr:bifunctional Helicase [Babesia duncani]
MIDELDDPSCLNEVIKVGNKSSNKLVAAQAESLETPIETSDWARSDPGAFENINYGSLGVLNVKAARAILDNRDVPVEQRLQIWHSLCTKDYVMLLTCAGIRDSCCLVHAESLIVHLCCATKKEGYSIWEYARGAQTLQFIYRVEKILQGFVECGGTFMLVFFDVFQDVFEEEFYSGYSLLREILLAHCKVNKLPYLKFHDWLTDPEWLKYCNNNEPTCIIVEDGSSFIYTHNVIIELLSTEGKGKCNTKNQQIYNNNEECVQKQAIWKFAANSLILRCLESNITVGYLFDITRNSTDYYAFVSFSSNVTKTLHLSRDVQDKMTSLYPIKEASENICTAILNELKAVDVHTTSLRTMVACNFLKALSEFNIDDASEDVRIYVKCCILVSKIYTIHNYLLEKLTLDMRSTIPFNNEEWEFYDVNVSAALDMLNSCAVSVVAGITQLEQFESNPNEIVDLFDGNLFCTILHLLIQYAKSHENVVHEDFLPIENIQEVTKIYSHYLKARESFYPIDLSPFIECGIYDGMEQNTQTNDNTPTELVMLDNAFVNLYFNIKNLSSSATFKLPDNSQAIAKFDALNWRDPAKITERLECIDYFLSSEDKSKNIGLPKRTVKQEQRSMQRKTQFSFLLSKYLGSSNLHYPIVAKLEHQWLNSKQNMLNKLSVACSAKTPSTRESGKKKEAKVSAKAELLRQKHNETQENKKRESDLKALARFEKQLPVLFSAELTYEALVVNILDYTSGPGRAVDLIGDFKWLKSVISLKEMQLRYLFKLISCLSVTFNGYKLRMIKNKACCNGMRRLVAYTIRLIHDCFNEYKSLIDHENIQTLQTLLIQLGNVSGAKQVFESWATQQSNEEGKKKSKQKNDKYRVTDVQKFDFGVPDGLEYEFQLAYMGDLMERTLGSTADSRVLFKPDAWQRMLLDVIDARESALVVAPTSTGKTYICYYAMEQGLRLDDEGIVIYVSPNNALALQVTYEITARFSSKVYGTGTSCAAVLSAAFLEKFHDPKWNCAQILVTIPTILERLLIAMRSNERNYAKRIEFLVLDEIHCISNIETGPFLERVIHLSACPFLALSATVGNPQQFHQWLSNVERVRRGDSEAKVHYIYFDERFSDVKLELYSDGSLSSLNPAACTTFYNIKNCGFPADFYLTSKDCYVFYKAIKEVIKDKSEQFDYLDPSFYFCETRCITKRQYRYYLETLKKEVSYLIQNDVISETDFNKIISFVKAVSTKEEYDIDDAFRIYPLLKLNCDYDKEQTLDSLKTVSHDYLEAERFLKMLNIMEQAKRLPCLVFIFDRNQMEHVLLSVTQLLQRKQWEKYYGSPEAMAATNLENKRRQDAYNLVMRQYEAQRKMRGASREQKEEQGVTDEEPMEMPTPPVDVAEDYDPEFNYYNRKIYVNYKDEVDSFINLAQSAISSRRNVNLFVEALRRGIGIHHEGLPHKFTMLTETLLRLGFLRVILSSRSLAFGVNVPCKSVMFAGDNYELTPLMYKQMSGRCGRRGFDLSGHVVFWCITEKKIKQLQTAQLDFLCGYYSSDPSQVLTALASFNSLLSVPKLAGGRSMDTKVRRQEIITKSRDVIIDPRTIVKRLSSIFLFPLESQFSLHEDNIARRVRFRISCEILSNLGFIDSRGLVRGCCEIAIITRDAHPCNLVVAHLIQSGKLHDILGNASDAPYRFIQLLSHMLYKKPLMACILDQRRLLDPKIRNGALSGKRLVSNLPFDSHDFTSIDLPFPHSFPLLPIQDDVANILAEFNELILTTIVMYLVLITTPCTKLPLSNLTFPQTHYGSKAEFFDEYTKLHAPTTCRNPFVAIGGKGNSQFTCARELWLGAPSGTTITMDMIPTIEVNQVRIIQLDSCFKMVNQYDLTLDNSYICDYWTHTKFHCIRDVNGLGQYAWYHLKKIITYLQHMKLAIKTLGVAGEDHIMDVVEQTLGRLETAFNRI